MQRTITVKANSQYTVPMNGQTARFFKCISATAQFQYQLDRRDRSTGTTGEGVAAEPFKRFSFFETSGSDNTITFEIGNDERIIAPPVSTVSTPTQIVPQATAPSSAEYVIQADDTIEQIAPASAVYVTSIEIFPASGLSTGALVANANEVYIGRTATQLPYVRQAADTDFPVIFTAPPGQKFLLSAIRVRGKAGDGVAYTYTPAS